MEVVYLKVKQNSNSILDYETDLISRAHAFLYVLAARSWIYFFHLSPDGYRIPCEAVLQRFMEYQVRGLEDACLASFWEELLEEHGYESDRQWQIRQKEYFPTARELVMAKYVAPMKGPNCKESWRGRPVLEIMHEPEFWALYPAVDIKQAIMNEEYRQEHPERFGEIRTKSKLRPARKIRLTYVDNPAYW